MFVSICLFQSICFGLVRFELVLATSEVIASNGTHFAMICSVDSPF